MELQLETTDKLVTHNTVDYITVGSADKIVLTPGANPNRLGSIDSLTVTPYQSATAVDYNIPQSVVQGLADVAAIREDLLQKLAGLELAIVEAQQYRDWVANDVRNQVFTEMSANYLSNAAMPEAIQAQILATDLSNMAIATGAGGTTASFQEIVDRYVEVGEAVSGFTSQLEANTTNASSALQQTEVLTARVGDVETTVTSMEYVAIGGFTEWDGASVPITGQWRGSSGAYEQYIGDEWITITDEQHSRYSIQLAIAGAKSLSTVGDTIVGWGYANGGVGDNKFQIRADVFKIVDSTVQTGDTPASPFSTVRNADGTHTIIFNGKVVFGNSVIDTRVGGTTVIDGSSITTGMISNQLPGGYTAAGTQFNVATGALHLGGASTLGVNTIYNNDMYIVNTTTGAVTVKPETDAAFKMKIDLLNGSIYIK